MRKLLLVGLLVLFTITVLSVEIVFWYPLSGTKGQVLKEIVERFDKAHPDIKVKLVYTGKYRETAQKVMSHW